jgi:hypothetical protein
MDDDARRAGRSLDDLSGPKMLAQLDRLVAKTKAVGTEARRTADSVDRLGGPAQTARIDRLGAQLDGLGRRLDDIGRKRATPSIDLQGFAAARTEIAALNRQLDQLSRRTATPRVGTSGGGLAGGGGVAGSVGGGRFPLGIPDWKVIAAGLGLPLIGAVPPILGSAVGAGLGAGALGIAGGGIATAGGLGVASVVKPMEAQIKQLNTLQQAALQQAALHGPGSKQAQAAQAKVTVAARRAPAGAQNLLVQANLLQKVWATDTRQGQGALTTAGGNIAARLRTVSPILGAAANTSAGAVAGSAQTFANFLTGPQELLAIQSLTHQFAEDLPIVENTLEHVVGTMSNLARAGAPFFRDGLVFVDHWAMKWDESTTGIDHTRQVIGGYVNDLKAWGHLTGETWDLIRDLIMPGRTQGTSLVDDLTQQLAKWDQWAKDNPDKLRRFYADAISGTKQLAGLIGTVGHDLNEVGQILLPVLSRFAALGNIAGGAGLLLPTALRLGLGRVTGGRTASTASGSTAAGLGGLVPVGVAGGAAATAGGGTAALGLGGLIALRARQTPVAQALGAGTAARTDWTGWTAADSTAPSLAAAARSTAATGLRTAGRFAGPLLLINAGINAAGTQGNLDQRIQAAASGLTFGILPGPTTGAQARDQGQAQANAYLQSLAAPQSAADYAHQIAALQAKQAAAAAKSRTTSSTGLFGNFGTLGLFDAGHGGDSGPTDVEAKRNAAAVLQYASAIGVLRKEQAAFQAEQKKRTAEASSIHGLSLADSFQQAFGILTPSKGPEAALRETLARVVTETKKIGPEGAKSLTQATIQWADAVSQGNPRMQRIVDDMTSGIEKRFSTMRKNVEIVNGQVLDGSTTEWKSIAAALITPAEKARQEVSASFTAIQQEAIGSLRAMGFSTSDAQKLISGQESGAISAATVTALTAPTGVAGLSVGAAVANQTADRHGVTKRARGGRLPGWGLNDTVPMADGGWGAPGELVLNRHTEGDADRDLAAAGKPSLWQRVARETRPHSAPMKRATGGRTGGFSPAPGTNYSVGEEPTIAAHLNALAMALGIHVTGISGYRSPAHSVAVGGFADDPHTHGEASDSPGIEGVPEATLEQYGLTRPFAGAAEADHIQLLAGGKGAAAVGGAAVATAIRAIALRAPGSRLGGVPGALSARAGQVYASALAARLNAHIAGGGATGGDGASISTVGGILAIAQQAAAAEGVPWNAGIVSTLLSKESGGGKNLPPHQYGGGLDPAGPFQVIGSTFNAYKVAGHPNRMNPVDNALAAFHYIHDRYGTLEHLATATGLLGGGYKGYSQGGRLAWGGWNAAGGDFMVNRPTVFGAGENGPERVTITPHGGSSASVTIGAGAVQITGSSTAQLRRFVQVELETFAKRVHAHIANGPEENERALIGA